MTDRATLDFYAAQAATYSAQISTATDHDLSAFLAQLPAQSRILELGCGSGRDAATMLAQGYLVEPTDGSPEMTRQAEARLRCSVRVLPFDRLLAVAAYEGVWANACLLHVQRAELTGVLARVHRALAPGGLFYASYKAGHAEGRDKFGRYYNYPSADEVAATYSAAAAWQDVTIAESAGAGYDGVPARWLAVWARRHRPRS